LDGCREREIAGNGNGSTALLLDLINHLLRRAAPLDDMQCRINTIPFVRKGCVEIVDCHTRTFSSKGSRGGRADAMVGARDEDNIFNQYLS
jgi:hypothetical protein